METGTKKAIYLMGVATAVNHKGRVVDLTRSDIYRKASRAFRDAKRENRVAALRVSESCRLDWDNDGQLLSLANRSLARLQPPFLFFQLHSFGASSKCWDAFSHEQKR